MDRGIAPNSNVEVGATLELLFRRRAGQLTSTLTRLFGIRYLDLVEDVVQDAFVQALRKWPSNGVPSDPGAWIVRVARNKAVDELRRQGRWEDKRHEFEASFRDLGKTDDVPLGSSIEVADDELRMIFAACHPTIPRNAQVALTLKVVGGFSVNEIAHAFLAPKATIAQRIVRAKRSLRQENVTLAIPPGSELRGQLDSVLEVIYLMFNEGYSATAGEAAVRTELCGEAIRLVELLADHPMVQEPRVE
ncbi:MAG: RNA polymerase sigma factor, partial [Longimicrobiales bacterium]